MGMGKTLTESAKLLVKLHGQGSQSIELTGDSFTIGRERRKRPSLRAETGSLFEAQRALGQHPVTPVRQFLRMVLETLE